MAKNNSKKKGGGAARSSGVKKQSAPTAKSTAAKPKSTAKTQTPEKKAKPASQKGVKLAELMKLGTAAHLDRALTRVKEKAESAGVDYIGVLKNPAFVPKTVTVPDEVSVRAVLDRLGEMKKEPVKEAPKVEAQNVNAGETKKAKAAPAEDEFKKRPRPNYTEDIIRIPKDFAVEFHIGKRDIPKTYNDPLINSRFGWKHGYPQSFGTPIETLDGAPVGTLAKIGLDDVFGKAERQLHGSGALPLSRDEFDKCMSTVKEYLGKKKRAERDVNDPLLVQDLFEIPELDFRELMLPRASEFVKTVKLACEYDMAETKMLISRWKKIKKYHYKVTLAYSDDGLGIFSDKDVGRLNSRGIRFINDIKAHNVIELKNLLLEKNFATLIEDVNAAFKEDRERRRDAGFKTYPFVFTTVSLLFAIFLNFTYKYTIIKDALGAAILNNTYVVWLLGLAIMTVGILRAPRRRRKHKSYRYFTRNVKRKVRHLAELSVIAIALSVLFFQRYDGYNTNVYYRFADDNTISIAGLVDDGIEELEIPEAIDGYKVVAIESRAFSGDGLRSVVLPSSLETVGKYAFSGCEALESVSARFGASGVKTIENNAFEKCTSLKSTEILATVETVGQDAFKKGGIEEIDLRSVKTLEAKAFRNLETLSRVTLSSSLEVIPESCFEGCMYIVEFSNYGGVKTIGKNALKDCMGIYDIKLDSVETIGESALEGCIALTEIVISDAVREIGKNAFKGCNNVLVFETPFIGKSKETSADYSFDYFINCNSLKKPFGVVLRGMTSIHSKAFEDCSSIVSVDFGDTVTEIQAGAFKNATSLQSITLPEVIATVEAEAFMGCSNLSVINGIEHVTHIEKSAFEGCTSITEINLSSVIKLGEGAFADCYSLKSIGSTESLTEIGKGALRGCYNITSLDFTISPLRSVGEGAFENCSNLTSVRMPDTISEIPAKAFYSCYGLDYFEFSSSIRTIGKEAFAYSGIEDPDFNGTLSEIGESAFRGCNDIETLEIPSSVKYVGKNAFKDCYSLNTVKAPFFGTEAGGKNGSDKVYGGNSIKHIVVVGSGTLTDKQMKAFKNTLISISVGGLVSEIGEGAFKSFKLLSSVSLGSSVKTIGKQAFYGCKELGSISLEESGVTSIGEKAFANAGLAKFTAGESLREIGKEAFSKSSISTLDISKAGQLRELPKKLCYGCESLTRIVFPESLDMIGEAAFRYCEDITSVSLNNVKTVGKLAFKNCDSLENLTLSGISVIEKEAFANTALSTVTIPNGCTELGDNVFKNCKSLDELVIANSVNKIGKNIFAGCRTLARLEIPFIGTDRSTPKKISSLGYYKSLVRIKITNADELAKSALKNCESLEVLTLNGGIKSIGEKAFEGCDELYRVYMPNSLSKFENIFPVGSVVYTEE